MSLLRDALAEPGRLLRNQGSYAIERRAVPIARLAAIVLVGSASYGAVMGSLGARLEGALHSAIKMPLLISTATLLCIPFFYVANGLFGVRADFAAALRGILSAQGTLALALASLAPATAAFYASGLSYAAALLTNAAVFALAALGAQRMLARHYRPLIARDPRHRRALFVWFVLHAFVATKMAWVLRPFVGDPALPAAFLRAGRWYEDPYTNLFWAAVGVVVRALRAFGAG